MHMRMRAVRMNQITQAETLAHPGIVFGKIFNVYRPAMASMPSTAKER